MFIHTAKSVVPVTALLIISVIAACGGEGTAARDDQTSTALPSPTTGTSAAPTATFVTVEVTPAPVPTEPPVPTATIRPTAEPTVELTDERAAAIIAETESQPIVEFPSEITPGADRLTPEEVLDAWHEYLGGTRIKVILDSILWEFCSDGTGTWVYEIGTPAFIGAKFNYELVNDPGASWHSIVVKIDLHDQQLKDLMNYSGGDFFRVGLIPPREDQIAYESPDCD